MGCLNLFNKTRPMQALVVMCDVCIQFNQFLQTQILTQKLTFDIFWINNRAQTDVSHL